MSGKPDMIGRRQTGVAPGGFTNKPFRSDRDKIPLEECHRRIREATDRICGHRSNQPHVRGKGMKPV